MATVKTVLLGKGPQVHTISSGATVADAVAKMNQLGIGALVVKDGGHGGFRDPEVPQRVQRFLGRVLQPTKL